MLNFEPGMQWLTGRINGEQSDFDTAIDKTCDFQKNACGEKANGDLKGQFSVSDCDDQSSEHISSTALAFDFAWH